jgi:hypothetical protein
VRRARPRQGSLERANREPVIVRPSRRENPEANDHNDHWDSNWLYATIEIAARGFRGEFEAQLRAEEFVCLRDQLRPLHEHLGGSARFETMEGWLRIDIQGDGKGALSRSVCRGRRARLG